MTIRDPKIGVPRVYDGASLPVLYPGESAHAEFTEEDVAAAIARGDGKVEVRRWLVEPSPGAFAWWLRLRYQVFDQWWPRGTPKLETSVQVRREGEDQNGK
jgi:hypothetical protein